MLRFVYSQFSRQVLKAKSLSHLRKLKYCTEKNENFINKNTISDPSSNYYDQYIEEYYEVEENLDDEEIIPLNLQKKERKTFEEKEFIWNVKEEKLIEILENERAINIESIKIEKKNEDDLKANEIAIICSPYNNRHAEALTTVIRSYLKSNYRFEKNQNPIVTKNNNGWYTFDMRKIILHIMVDGMRKKYDLESLYRNTDEEKVEDDIFDEKPENEIIEVEEEEIYVVEKKDN